MWERGWWEREAGVGGIGARVIVEGERLLCEREIAEIGDRDVGFGVSEGGIWV